MSKQIEKDLYYFQGKLFHSTEEMFEYSRKWQEEITDQETFERLWRHLGKEIWMNTCLRGIELKNKETNHTFSESLRVFLAMVDQFREKDAQ